MEQDVSRGTQPSRREWGARPDLHSHLHPSIHSLRMYNSLVERCFRDCVDTFRRKDLEPAEEKVKEERRMDGWMERWGSLFSLQARSRTPSHSLTVRPKVLREVHEALVPGGRAVCGAVEPGKRKWEEERRMMKSIWWW